MDYVLVEEMKVAEAILLFDLLKAMEEDYEEIDEE